MKHKILKTTLFLSLLFFFFISLTAITTMIDPDEYIVKAGDIFFIQASIMDTLIVRSPVLPGGGLSLFPLADSVKVAGLSLTDTYNAINHKIGDNIPQNRILIQLGVISPIRFTAIGAISRPGEHIAESIVTLHQAIGIAGGTSSTASRKIKIMRGDRILTYDLNLLYAQGDTNENPFIMQDDVIIVEIAQNYVRIVTNSDTTNMIEVIELDDTEESIVEVIRKSTNRHHLSNMNTFTIERNNEFIVADKDFLLKPYDNMYISLHEMYVYVTGYIVRPGRFTFSANRDAHFYITQSGGTSPNGSMSKIYLVKENGELETYEGQRIEPGDVIYIPESLRSKVVSWLIPISTVVSLIYTVILVGVTMR